MEANKNRKKTQHSGETEKRIKWMSVLFAGMALLCLVYCLMIFFVMRFGTYFFMIWGALAVGFAVLAILFAKKSRIEKIPKWIRKTCKGLVCVGLLLFFIVEGIIFSKFAEKAEQEADVVIILGAQWRSSGPSIVLQQRLDTAAEYLKKHPDTKVIVSGGKGSNEPISEAEGMYQYLVSKGIAAERIYQENQSTSTYENFKFSEAYCNKELDKVLVITNNYHVFRAEKLAEKMGYQKVEGLAAPSAISMLPNNLLREFLAVIKDFLVGNI